MRPSKSYHQVHWLEKTLDGVLLASVIIGIFLISLELFFSPGPGMLRMIYRVDALLLGVFFVDSSRTFFKSKSLHQYLRHHWLDLILLMIVIISFSSVLFTGIGRMRWLVQEEKIFTGLGKYVSLSFMRRVK